MSGGSFDYLCYKEGSELFDYSVQRSMREMAAELTERGAQDAAAETEQLIRFVEHALRQVEPRREALAAVWRAVEWCTSGDIGEDGVEAALARYRKTEAAQ